MIIMTSVWLLWYYSCVENDDVAVSHFLDQCATPQELLKSIKTTMSAQ